MDKIGLGLFEKVILVFSAIGATCSGFALFNPQFIERQFVTANTNVQKIGHINFSRNDVRRKLGDSYLWFQVDQDETLFNNDSIFTGSNSETEITIAEDTQIRLGENSLVVLDLSHNSSLLDLKLGSAFLNLASNQSINLKHNGKMAKISGKSKNSKIGISVGEGGQLLVKPKKSNIQIEINNKPHKAGNGEVIILSKDNKTQVKKLDLDLIQPEVNDQVWVDPNNKTLEFKWSTSGNWPGGKLLVSKDKNFENIILEQEVSGLSKKTENIITEKGSYFWKIEPNNQPEQTSTANAFSVHLLNPPQLIFPVNYTFKDSSKEKEKIKFKWEAKYGVRNYNLQVYSGNDSGKAVINERVNKNSKSNIELGRGNYSWRVRALDDSPIANKWSELGSFKIGETAPLLAKVMPVEAPPVTPTPEPVVPEPTTNTSLKSASSKPAEIEFVKVKQPIIKQKNMSHIFIFDESKVKRGIASIEKLIVNPPELKWIKVDEANKYEVEISKNKKFDNDVVVMESSNNSIKWKTSLPGKYYWRVKALNDSEASVPSNIGMLELFIPTPTWKVDNIKTDFKISDPDKLEKKGPPVKIAWKRVPTAHSYKLEFSKLDGSNSKKGTITTKKPMHDFSPLSNGNYQFKLAALGPNKNIISKYSKSIKLNYKKSVELKLPIVDSPNNGVTIVKFGGNSNEPIIFVWKRVKHAKSYSLQFSKDPNFNEILNEKIIKQNQYILEDIPDGKTYWRLRSQNKSYFSKWSSPRSFELQSN